MFWFVVWLFGCCWFGLVPVWSWVGFLRLNGLVVRFLGRISCVLGSVGLCLGLLGIGCLLLVVSWLMVNFVRFFVSQTACSGLCLNCLYLFVEWFDSVKSGGV